MARPLPRSLPFAGALALLAAAACTSTSVECQQTKCGDACVNTTLDPANCGGCFQACAPLFVCQATGEGESAEGRCVCPAGQDCSPQACGGACGTGQHCIDDTCVAGDVFAACFQAGSVVPLLGSSLAVSGSPYTGLDGAQALAALDDTHVLAVGSLDSVLHVIDRTTMTGTKTVDLLPSGGACPNQLVVKDGTVYVVNSCVNSVEAIDPSKPEVAAVLDEVSTGAGTNPFGAAFAPDGRLWVSLWVTDQVVPVTFGEDGKGTLGTPIPLTLPGGEGKPYPAGVAAIGDAVYVTLNNLDENYAPTGTGGKVAVIRADAVDSILDLGTDCRNPGFTATEGTTLWIACTGSYGAGDGEVVALDTTTGQVSRRVNTGGAPSRLSAATDGGVWAADAAGLDVIRIAAGLEPVRVTACPEGMLEFVGDVLAY